MSRKTKIARAMEALRRVRMQVGDARFRAMASGSRQCMIRTSDISEATINAARRRLLKGE